MPTISSTLSLAKRALLAHQGAMGTGADNVANVNTLGYARKKVDLQSSPSLYTPLGGFGTGVDLLGMKGVRDIFIERQVRSAMSESGKYEEGSRQMQMIEETIGALSDTGLSDAFDKFWNGWHDLANDPASMSSRHALREAARNLVGIFNGIDSNLNLQTDNINQEIADKVDQINTITQELASINRDLLRLRGEAPDLVDRRELLLDELSTLAGVDYKLEDDHTVSVFLDGASLVMDDKVQTVGTELDDNGNLQLIIVDEVKRNIDVRGGEIGALIDVRDGELTELRAKLDELAVTLVREVNNLHKTGFGLNGSTGMDFFDVDTTGISDISLDWRIEDDAALIAASADGSEGDNSLALAIADLEQKAAFSEGTETLGQVFSSISAWFGAKVAHAEDLAEGAKLSLQQIEAWRESVSGVSLDEEMAQLIRYQLAFNASAKLVNMADSMMQQVLAMVS